MLKKMLGDVVFYGSNAMTQIGPPLLVLGLLLGLNGLMSGNDRNEFFFGSEGTLIFLAGFICTLLGGILAGNKPLVFGALAGFALACAAYAVFSVHPGMWPIRFATGALALGLVMVLYRGYSRAW